jgi:prepilin-type N-terminal cleavage/methylation domain-containing protein
MKNKLGFTLIEVIVSISILSIIMISIFAIFNLSADLNNKIDISRSMQENIKNIRQIISEDISTNKIT